MSATSTDGNLVSFQKQVPNSVIFHADGQEVMRLDKDGMLYKGQRIEDAGAAHKAFMEVMGALRRDGPSSVSAEELKRLREIEHMAWHVLDDSAEDAQTGDVSITPSEDYFKLCELLPEAHPETLDATSRSTG